MQRFIMEKLVKWKNDNNRKPLILKGARQVGKTYILKEFAKNEYFDLAYFNFDHDESLASLFKNSKDPKRIIEQLILVHGKKIVPGKTLIFFDEIQELRRNLNRILNPQYSATLTYELGDFKRVIGCTINNAPIFKRGTILEQFTIQLSCLNPFWREEAETREDIATWIGGFEFPVPDGLEITEDWEIGYRQPSLIVNVFNSGDVKSGIRIEFRALGALTNPQLLNVNTQEFIKANISLEAGDVLTVSTGYGEKSVKLTRNGAESDAFRYLDVDSSYLQLAVGDNLFRYSADTNAENLEVSIYHNNLYLGV